ncbi:MAG: hypothetical protein KAI71_04715 [Candidatus Pacebacteria bacterium]|nr:hypothetical protein [Candidatus Paceibacterota bacterium]
MIKSKKIYVIFGLIVLFLIIASSVVSCRDQKDIVRITQEWANLSSFPENAKITSVKKTGSIFTRGFRVKFTAPEKDIRKWLHDSPSTSLITPEKNGDVEKYFIKSAGGAQFAEIIYNTKTNEVYVRVYWS